MSDAPGTQMVAVLGSAGFVGRAVAAEPRAGQVLSRSIWVHDAGRPHAHALVLGDELHVLPDRGGQPVQVTRAATALAQGTRW